VPGSYGFRANPHVESVDDVRRHTAPPGPPGDQAFSPGVTVAAGPPVS
jgi:hypothetical protein